MIEIQQELNVSKEKFFNQLLLSVQQEIKSATGKNIKLDEIKSGFSYEKKMTSKVKTTGNVTIIIDKLVDNQLYRMRLVSKQGVNVVEYNFKEITPEKIEASYKEWFETTSKLTEWNQKLMTFLYAKKGKERVRNMLLAMEAYILENGGK